jgi:hypothetical protein
MDRMQCARELVVALSALTACGRLEFTPSADPDARADGASIPACAGHDEDGDGVGDACDRCPTVADPGQKDQGELDAGNAPDGVGDACDPRPALGGDRIALFESYAVVPQLTFSTFGPVSWDTSDALVLGGAGATGQARFDSIVTFTRAELTYRMRAVSPGQPVYGGLWARISNDELTDSVFPQITDMTSNGIPAEILIKESTGTGDNYSPYGRFARELAGGDAFRTVHDTELVTGGPQRFTVDAFGTSERIQVELVITRPFTGRYVIEAVNFEMELQSFVLYDAP